MDERKRDSIIAYLRRNVTEVGIDIDDLAAALAEDEQHHKSARYRSATGDTWGGDGEMPPWLVQAVNAGQALEHFAVNHVSHSVASQRNKADWREDPFAGSRLATSQPQHRDAR
ncbi:H-NS family nucleoid-associated regulatory protein [Paraburkholderia terrae]|uniref:H-NS family nucleoid-associated regulatory protein n=1 Tax=Paraburkholderia terrae TaxID=311230 RepID=UPI0037C9F608